MRPHLLAPLLCEVLVACEGGSFADSSADPSSARAGVLTQAPGVPMDGTPARAFPSPTGPHEARVRRGGELRLWDGRREVLVAEAVVAEIAWSPDGTAVVFPADAGFGADLWQATAPGWTAEPLIAWHGPEDRPLWSPDGEKLAFVAGTDGLPSVWVLDAATGATHRLTNEGVVARKRPGRAPEGFVPPPDGRRFEWTADGLLWTADDQVWTAGVPR